MKKQYRWEDVSWCKRRLCLYHDGELVDSKIFYTDEAAIEDPEDYGYTLGYTKEEIEKEVEKARLRYEEMLRNMI